MPAKQYRLHTMGVIDVTKFFFEANGSMVASYGGHGIHPVSMVVPWPPSNVIWCAVGMPLYLLVNGMSAKSPHIERMIAGPWSNDSPNTPFGNTSPHG